MSKFSEDVPREIVRAFENQAFDIAKIKARLSNQFQKIVDVEERLSVLEQSKEEPVDIQKPNFGKKEVQPEQWIETVYCMRCGKLHNIKSKPRVIVCECGHTMNFNYPICFKKP